MTDHSQAANLKKKYSISDHKPEIVKHLQSSPTAKIKIQLLQYDWFTNAKAAPHSYNQWHLFYRGKGGHKILEDSLMARVKKTKLSNNGLDWLKIKNVQLQQNLSLKEAVVFSTIQRQFQRETKKNNSFQLNRKSSQSWNQPSSTTKHCNRILQTSKI